MGDAQGMAKLCIGMVAYSVGFQGREYSWNERPAGEFYELEVLRCAARRYRTDNSLKEDKRRIAAVGDGLERLLESENAVV